MEKPNWPFLNQTIIECEKCPRLRRYCTRIAREKKKAFRNETYWGLPIPGFGDTRARVLIVGLAPAAHGANRTGRIFTGDRSGEWLYRALFKAGLANRPHSEHRNDDLRLKGAFVSCLVRCAPPKNKPTPIEIRRCIGYLETEIQLLRSVRVFVCLGQLSLHTLWPLISGMRPGDRRPRPRFAHGAMERLSDGRLLVMSYHPSQQNTFTGKLTEPMFDRVFAIAREELEESMRRP